MAFAATPTGRGDLVVVVTLRGVADGHSLVPPVADHAHVAARPDIAVRSAQSLHLHRLFGLHPGLSPLLPFWHSRRLVVVHAVGDSDGTRSHFEATDAMERGVRAANRTSSGWVDRLMTARELRAGDFPAVAIGNQTPVALRGPAPDLAVSDLHNLRVQVSEDRRRATEAALAQMYAGVAGHYADAARGTLAAMRQLAPLTTKPYAPRSGADYPDDQLGRSLKQIAHVARAGLGMQVACVEGSGWDMHEGMGTAGAGYVHDLVSRLGQALAAFARDLGRCWPRRRS